MKSLYNNEQNICNHSRQTIIYKLSNVGKTQYSTQLNILQSSR